MAAKRWRWDRFVRARKPEPDWADRLLAIYQARRRRPERVPTRLIADLDAPDLATTGRPLCADTGDTAHVALGDTLYHFRTDDAGGERIVGKVVFTGGTITHVLACDRRVAVCSERGVLLCAPPGVGVVSLGGPVRDAAVWNPHLSFWLRKDGELSFVDARDGENHPVGSFGRLVTSVAHDGHRVVVGGAGLAGEGSVSVTDLRMADAPIGLHRLPAVVRDVCCVTDRVAAATARGLHWVLPHGKVRGTEVAEPLRTVAALDGMVVAGGRRGVVGVMMSGKRCHESPEDALQVVRTTSGFAVSTKTECIVLHAVPTPPRRATPAAPSLLAPTLR